jgi:hypothetical protein
VQIYKKNLNFLAYLKKKNKFALDFNVELRKLKRMMTNADKELVFSESVKAGKRIYYFDVKQSRNGDKYVAITESKKIVSGPEDNPQISYEKHKVFLYKEDFEKFTNALNKAIDVATTGVVPAEETETAEAETVEPVDSNIDIQF